jgi:hypothetical protein
MILDYGTWNSRSTLPSPTIRRADAALADSGPGWRSDQSRRPADVACRMSLRAHKRTDRGSRSLTQAGM